MRESRAGDDADAELESAMRARLAATGEGATFCPSDIARTVRPEGWRPLMEPTREMARRLVAEGIAEITQGGRVVDPAELKGPIRIRPRR